MKKTISNKAIQFNTRYANLDVDCKRIKKELKKQIPFIRDLAKKARTLSKYAEKNCFTEDNHGIHPIDGIKYLGAKLDLLDWIYDEVDEFKTLANSFDLQIK